MPGSQEKLDDANYLTTARKFDRYRHGRRYPSMQGRAGNGVTTTVTKTGLRTFGAFSIFSRFDQDALGSQEMKVLIVERVRLRTKPKIATYFAPVSRGIDSCFCGGPTYVLTQEGSHDEARDVSPGKPHHTKVMLPSDDRDDYSKVT